MLVVTSETIANKRIVKTLGIVRGNTVRARHIGKDIMAGLRNIVGGEVHEYAKLVAESREQSLDRMTKEAAELVPTRSSPLDSQRRCSWGVRQSCWPSARPSLSRTNDHALCAHPAHGGVGFFTRLCLGST